MADLADLNKLQQQDACPANNGLADKSIETESPKVEKVKIEDKPTSLPNSLQLFLTRCCLLS